MQVKLFLIKHLPKILVLSIAIAAALAPAFVKYDFPRHVET